MSEGGTRVQTTRDLLVLALVMLLAAGWLVAGPCGFGVALAVAALALAAYALLREVDPVAEVQRPRRRHEANQ